MNSVSFHAKVFTHAYPNTFGFIKSRFELNTWMTHARVTAPVWVSISAVAPADVWGFVSILYPVLSFKLVGTWYFFGVSKS